MPPDVLFSHAGTAAMVGWALLILGPRRYEWVNAVALWAIPGLLSVGYGLIVLSRFAGAGGGYGSLAAVGTLMANEWALLAAWVHFLAFDLFVGAIMAARMDRVAIGRVVQGPILLAMFMFGPLGFVIAALTELALRMVQHPSTPLLKGARHVPA